MRWFGHDLWWLGLEVRVPGTFGVSNFDPPYLSSQFWWNGEVVTFNSLLTFLQEEANHKGDMLQEQVRVGKKGKQKHSKKMADFRHEDHNARSKKMKQKKKPKKS